MNLTLTCGEHSAEFAIPDDVLKPGALDLALQRFIKPALVVVLSRATGTELMEFMRAEGVPQ